MHFHAQTPENLKTRLGEESFNDDGLVQRSIRLLKDKFPDLEAGPPPPARILHAETAIPAAPGSPVTGCSSPAMEHRQMCACLARVDGWLLASPDV